MLLTFQGFFEKGQFIPSDPVQVPEHKKVIVTVLDEAVSSKAVQEKDLAEKQAAYQRLLKYSGTLDRHVDYKKERLEYLDERYGNTN
ncbi:hypothetical protein FACS189491_07760 [Spirochaetia bacterium]|nr:hypothetical protein FACS189491_07760 [Spirochaetia bacterium]